MSTKSTRKIDGKTTVYMNPSDKERFVRIAEEHGLNLSAFFASSITLSPFRRESVRC